MRTLAVEEPIEGLPETIPALDGVSLRDAYLRFLEWKFTPPNARPTDGALVLTEDAAEAFNRAEARLGLIKRPSTLVCAGDSWDDAANQLISDGTLTIEDARADVLVHRLFWQLFIDGTWFAVGRPHLNGPDRVLEKFEWKALRVANLRESTLGDGEGARLVAVRVYSPAFLPASAILSDEIGEEAEAGGQHPFSPLQRLLKENRVGSRHKPVALALADMGIEPPKSIDKYLLNDMEDYFSRKNLPYPGRDNVRTHIKKLFTLLNSQV